MTDRERGSAVVDFVLVSILVTFLFLGVLQLGFALHTRNTLIASAAEGARVAARADATLDDGVARTRQLISDQLSERFAQQISADEVADGGMRQVRIQVSAPVPVIGPFGVGGDARIEARAFSERQ